MTNPNKLADALKLIERMRFAIQGSYFTTGRGEHVSLPHQLDPSDLAALDKEAAAFLAEHDAQPATGEWVWVPREATEAMCDAGNDGAAPYMVDAKVLWRQMIAAAPQRAPAPVQVCPQCNNTGMMMIGDAQGLCWCPAGDKEREARGLPPDAHPPAPAADECLDCAYNPGLCDEHDNGGKPLHPPAADGAGELPPLPDLAIGTFRKKPVAIKAVQLTRENGQAVATWCGGQWLSLYGRGDRGEDISHVSITTLEGIMRADLGDWIIKGVKGEFYPCKPGIFAATYDAANAADIDDPSAATWRERWEGSGPQKGWHIVESTRLYNNKRVAYLGESPTSEAVTAIVVAHNAAIAALRQPVTDAVRELPGKWRLKAKSARAYGHVEEALAREFNADELESALASQPESRNAD